MNPIVTSALKEISRKIRELEEAKRCLLTAFDMEVQKQSAVSTRPLPPVQAGEKPKQTRGDVIFSLLTVTPGLTKGQIQKQTQFPDGTIAYALNDKRRFENRDRRWYIRGQQSMDPQEEAKGK